MSDWDLLNLISAWNLYGLPALLGLVLLAAVGRRCRRRQRGGSAAAGSAAPSGRRNAVRMIALIHAGLAIRWGLALAQELLTLREQGIPQSFPVTGMVAPAVAIVVNLAVGHGLWRLRGWGRRGAIAWDGLTAAVSALVAAWQWRYHAQVRLDQWPDYLVSDVLPWFLLVVMLLPGTRALFRAARTAGAASERPAAPGGHSWTATLTLLFLIVVTSTLLIDAADWLARLLNEGA